MRRIADQPGFPAAFSLLLLALLVVAIASSPGAPSQEECVALWNARPNAPLRARVAVYRYPVAEIEGAFVVGRYQGCFLWLVEAIGEPWALYSATRIPGEDRLLRWVLDMRGERWGIDFPEPEPRPDPNSLVFPDGSLRLGEAGSHR